MCEFLESMECYLFDSAYFNYCQYIDNKSHSPSLAAKFLAEAEKLVSAANVLADGKYSFFSLEYLAVKYLTEINGFNDSPGHEQAFINSEPYQDRYYFDVAEIPTSHESFPLFPTYGQIYEFPCDDDDIPF